jgi:hypothetical protein
MLNNMFFDYLLNGVLLGHYLQYFLKVIDISLISQSGMKKGDHSSIINFLEF